MATQRETTVTFRAAQDDVIRWKKAAEREERLFSDWIRRALDLRAEALEPRTWNAEGRSIPLAEEDRSLKRAVADMAEQVENPVQIDPPKPRVRESRLPKLPLVGEHAKAAAKREIKTCEHGKSKGYHCWQCGGLAKVEG
jgi:hypothetical protein